MYSIGIDYGTQSCRAILVDNVTGEELAIAEASYHHGVMETTMPDGIIKLEPDFALQHPKDYIEVLMDVCKRVMDDTNIEADKITGVGVDFTACTILPIDSNGKPLCFEEAFKDNPHAYVKLWKHHAAQPYADRINALAYKKEEEFLSYYGGKISSEWLFPKLMEIIDKAPEVYEAADQFVEAGDWIVMQLTGKLRRSSCMAGYKGMWHKKAGYPSQAFLKELMPELEHCVDSKLRGGVYPLGSKAGTVYEHGSKLTGLKEGTSVAVAVIDAHSAYQLPAYLKRGKC